MLFAVSNEQAPPEWLDCIRPEHRQLRALLENLEETEACVPQGKAALWVKAVDNDEILGHYAKGRTTPHPTG